MSGAAPITRRHFLGTAVAAGLALSAGRARAARRRRAVVVGAGLAGLACAHELERKRWDVVVLEARDRVGGRVWTIREPFGAAQHAEAGGEYVARSHRTLLGYARRLGLSLEDVRRGPDLDGVYFFGGRRRHEGAVLTQEVQAEIDRFWSRVEALGRRIDPADPVAAGKALDRRSARWFLNRLKLDPVARGLVEHDLRDEFTVEPENLSLLFLAQSAKLSGVEALRIRGGNDQLPLAIAGSLRREVLLEAPVRKVERSASGVTVTAGGDRWKADACVLAVPVPALRGIELVPELSAGLQRAVDELRYGHGTKTLLQYERRFWRERRESGDVLTDLKVQTVWEATDRQRGKPGVLLGYTTGHNGILYGSVGDGARILLAADEIDDVYPGSRALLDVGATAAWHNDGYSGGTYTAYAPGQVTLFWRVLRKPVGRMYLAGEHADAYTGTMEGAMRSGRRIAAVVDTRGR